MHQIPISNSVPQKYPKIIRPTFQLSTFDPEAHASRAREQLSRGIFELPLSRQTRVSSRKFEAAAPSETQL